jgi:hypothetical protein
MGTSKDAAEWMLTAVRTSPRLTQSRAVRALKREFGEEAVYKNENGNLAISKDVLREFRQQGGNEVVWSKKDRYWRLRRETDPPGKRQLERTRSRKRKSNG